MNHLLKMSLLSFLLPVMAMAQDNIVLENQAREKIKTFAESLRSELVMAIQQGGIEQGISICHHRAPEIAAQMSIDGWRLGRTSLKVRNAENTPDSWEKNVLQQFQRRYEKGEDIQSLTASATVSNQISTHFRYMQAIPADGVCLACHGTDLAPSTKKVLEKYYPNDQATGYKINELRGAFSLMKALKKR